LLFSPNYSTLKAIRFGNIYEIVSEAFNLNDRGTIKGDFAETVDDAAKDFMEGLMTLNSI
jgi:hypothetical protein